jgi:hypothetical protein
MNASIRSVPFASSNAIVPGADEVDGHRLEVGEGRSGGPATLNVACTGPSISATAASIDRAVPQVDREERVRYRTGPRRHVPETPG